MRLSKAKNVKNVVERCFQKSIKIPISFLDYQRSYRDNEMMSSSFNSAYQWSSMNDNEYDNAPFQRCNNVYWTLQTRSKAGDQRHPNNNAYQTRDDSAQTRQEVESLYSTPNKNRANQLKTTPLGFEFYSPVAPSHLNERIAEEEEEEVDCKEIMSPIDPRNAGMFSTSTPQRNPNFSTMSPAKTAITEDLRSRLRSQNPGIRSHGNSPISSGRSTPSRVFEPQQQTRSRHSWSANNVDVPASTCSDRLGTPKTSLMDFKKLLLNKNTSVKAGKISAVELLKQSKSNAQKAPSPTPGSLNNSMNILDLSGSPKTFATRRMIRQGQFGPSLSNSPVKSNSKQKHAWRMANMRTDVISTAIPEAANDEEQETATSSSSQQRKPIEIKKSPEIVIKDVTEVEAEVEHEKASEANKAVSLKENLFIKQQENNFTENEIREHKKSAQHNFQQQRAQFLFGVTAPSSNPSTINNNNNKTAVFKSGGHYTGIVTSPNNSKDVNTLPASLETAL